MIKFIIKIEKIVDLLNELKQYVKYPHKAPKTCQGWFDRRRKIWFYDFVSSFHIEGLIISAVADLDIEKAKDPLIE